MTEAEIEALEDPTTWSGTFDERTHAALDLADAMCGDAYALDPALVTRLRSAFTEIELAEVILVCGQANLNNRAGNAAKRLLGPEG